jgi:putative FmdB family regulatory protein
MPIYQFYCERCHRLYNFLARRVSDRRPACPRCGREHLERRPAPFAVSRGKEEAPSPDGDRMPEGLDQEGLSRAMAALEGEAEGLEENPKALAKLMRRFWDSSGLKLGPGMEEALRRMEAGEDPEAIEAEMGDALESEDPLAAVSQPSGKKRSWRRYIPPTEDPELFEL